MSDASERRVLHAVRQHAHDGLLPGAAWTLGLADDTFAALCARLGLVLPAPGAPQPAEPEPALLQPLIDLLWAHRSGEGAWTRLMAGAVASASFGARHLWQDLGASGRPEVSALMQHHFRALAALNVHDLKWKNHLFRSLGEQRGIAGLRPPKCDGCGEQPRCFPGGPTATVQFKRDRADPAVTQQPAASAAG